MALKNNSQGIKKMKIMKWIFSLALVFMTIFLGCEKKPDLKIVCGVENPAENLAWLADLISKAENDNTGNYIGHIWIKAYNGKDYIITDMAMGTGGIMYYCFNCQGEIDTIADLYFYNSLNDDDLV